MKLSLHFHDINYILPYFSAWSVNFHDLYLSNNQKQVLYLHPFYSGTALLLKCKNPFSSSMRFRENSIGKPGVANKSFI